MLRVSGDCGPTTAPASFQPPVHLALARELLARGLPWCYRELSGSMLPAIRPYDVVEVRPARADALRPGDVVAVLRPEGLQVHRFVRWTDGPAGERWLILRGDARRLCDPPCPAAWLLGEAIWLERNGRRRRVARRWPGTVALPAPLARCLRRIAALLY